MLDLRRDLREMHRGSSASGRHEGPRWENEGQQPGRGRVVARLFFLTGGLVRETNVTNVCDLLLPQATVVSMYAAST